jgi:hypothetical protein
MNENVSNNLEFGTNPGRQQRDRKSNLMKQSPDGTKLGFNAFSKIKPRTD